MGTGAVRMFAGRRGGTKYFLQGLNSHQENRYSQQVFSGGIASGLQLQVLPCPELRERMNHRNRFRVTVLNFGGINEPLQLQNWAFLN